MQAWASPGSRGSGSVSLGVPLGEGPRLRGRRTLAPRPKGRRGKLTHYPAISDVQPSVTVTSSVQLLPAFASAKLGDVGEVVPAVPDLEGDQLPQVLAP